MMAPVDSAVFHLCTRPALAAVPRGESYRADSLVQEGFIHLSRAHQVLPTAAAYFGGVPDVVVLVVDPAQLTAPLRYEPPAPLPTDAPKPASEELYPHCYGPIDRAAIVDVIPVEWFTGQPIHDDTMALLRRFRFERLPVEGTLYTSTWRAARATPDGGPVGTAMIGLYADSPRSYSTFHRLTHDEVWHAYGGDPFVLHLLHANGQLEQVRMGVNAAGGDHVQYVVPAGTWQAGELLPGGRYALFGCTMAPGFTGTCFEGARADLLMPQYPAAAALIARLCVGDGHTHMPTGFAT